MRNLCRPPLLALLLAAPLTATSASQPAPPSDVPTSRTQVLQLHYRVTPAQPALLRAELWYSTDQGQTWWHYGQDPDCTPPMLFHAPGEGLYAFYLVAVNQAGPSSQPPRPGTPPHSWCLIDLTPPVLQLHQISKSANFALDRTVHLEWSAYDAYPAPRPVSIYYQNGDTAWQPIQTDLPEASQYDWRVLPNISGPVRIKLTAVDQAGNLTEHTSPQLTLEPPPLTSQPAPPETPPHPQTPAATEPPQPPTASLAQQARHLYDLGSWHLLRSESDVAAERFREALQIDPTLVEARNDLAGILLQKGQYDQALQEYRSVLALSPTQPEALMGSALTYVRRHEYPRARDALQQMLLTRPDDPQIWLNLGDVALMMGQRAQARACWQKAAEVQPAATDFVARARQRLEAYPDRR